MTHFIKALMLLPLHVAFCSAQSAYNAPKVQHAYGLPEAKLKEKGTLTVDSEGLTFTGKSSRYIIPGPAIVAVSTGSERVELWGTTGRIVRMAIPNGGGLAAAGVMHHKINQLTVEFHDARGAYHGAVFYLPGEDAARILESYSRIAPSHSGTANESETPAPVCQNSSVSPHNVLVAAPDWNQAEVPAAYRALVYEHVVDRLRRVDGIGHVYREGEIDYQDACPQYTVRISIVSFKRGNQVKRATMGPIGFFAGTTQMTFNASITGASGQLNVTEQVKATVRGESESKNVADGAAKKLAKRYAAALKQLETTK